MLLHCFLGAFLHVLCLFPQGLAANSREYAFQNVAVDHVQLWVDFGLGQGAGVAGLLGGWVLWPVDIAEEGGEDLVGSLVRVVLKLHHGLELRQGVAIVPLAVLGQGLHRLTNVSHLPLQAFQVFLYIL